MKRRTQEIIVISVGAGIYFAWWLWAGGWRVLWDWVAGWWPW